MPKRHKKHREYGFSGVAFDSLLKNALPSEPIMHGYQYGCNNIYNTCAELYGRDNSVRLHGSGLFFIKSNNGVVLNKYPFGVKKLTVLRKELDGYHYPQEVDYKVYYFHDEPLLLEVEVDPFLYSGETDDGYYLFRYDDRQKRFIEVEYDEATKKLVDKE